MQVKHDVNMYAKTGPYITIIVNLSMSQIPFAFRISHTDLILA